MDNLQDENNETLNNQDNSQNTALSDLQGKHDRLKQQADGSYQEATKNFDIISNLVGKDNKLLDSIKESNPEIANKLSEKLWIKPESPKKWEEELYNEDELFTRWEARQESKKATKSLEDMLSIYSEEDRKTINDEYKETVWDKVITNDRMNKIIKMIATSLNKEAIRENTLANMASWNFNNIWVPITKVWKVKSREDITQEHKDLAKTLWWGKI